MMRRVLLSFVGGAAISVLSYAIAVDMSSGSAPGDVIAISYGCGFLAGVICVFGPIVAAVWAEIHVKPPAEEE